MYIQCTDHESQCIKWDGETDVEMRVVRKKKEEPGQIKSVNEIASNCFFFFYLSVSCSYEKDILFMSLISFQADVIVVVFHFIIMGSIYESCKMSK